MGYFFTGNIGGEERWILRASLRLLLNGRGSCQRLRTSLTTIQHPQRSLQKIQPPQILRRNHRHRIRLGPSQQPQTPPPPSQPPRQHLRYRKPPPFFRSRFLQRPSLNTQSPHLRANDKDPTHLRIRRGNPHLHKNLPHLLPRSPNLPRLHLQRKTPQPLNPNRTPPPPSRRAQRPARPKPHLPHPRPRSTSSRRPSHFYRRQGNQASRYE